MTVAAFATVLAVADPLPIDLDRYLKSLVFERRLRVQAAEDEEEPEIADDWREWTDGARHWFRGLCLDLEGDEAVPPGVGSEREGS